MKAELVEGCINDWLGVDGIREVDMTEEQRMYYYDQIMQNIMEIEPYWFNYFLRWACEQFGEYECSEKPCEQCGDYTTTYTLEI